MRYWTLITSLFAGLFLAAGAAVAGKAVVEVSHGSFEPAKVEISAGEKVVFRNVVDMPGGHTIAFEDIEAGSGALANGEKWAHVFDEPGTYHFYVAEHPENKGTVVVK